MLHPLYVWQQLLVTTVGCKPVLHGHYALLVRASSSAVIHAVLLGRVVGMTCERWLHLCQDVYHLLIAAPFVCLAGGGRCRVARALQHADVVFTPVENSADLLLYVCADKGHLLWYLCCWQICHTVNRQTLSEACRALSAGFPLQTCVCHWAGGAWG